jgi:hypothetical protein
MEEVIVRYINEVWVSLGMIAEYAIHSPPSDGDPRNWHAHVLLTLRDLTPDGFGNKNRTWTPWKDSSLLIKWRKSWADAFNATLERYGFEGRVDHRSHKDRGIDRDPQRYKGKARTDIIPSFINHVLFIIIS